jgi:hypothetical protein
MTTFLAIWGAVVATIAIVWNIRRDLVDRGKLKVVCYIGQIVGSGVGPTDPTRRLVYNVTNIGRRSVIVTHIGGKLTADTNFMVPNAKVPRTLQPGEYFNEYCDLSVLHDKPQELWALDSLGKYWKIPRKQLRNLIKNCQNR